MKFTNKFDLPDVIVRAAQKSNEKYDRGKVDRSVTQLIAPPQIDLLRKYHFHEIEKDISDEWWALFGSAVHSILELGKNDKMIVEERLFLTVDGWKISGMADMQEKEGVLTNLYDYKVTSAYALTLGDGEAKTEWEQQLNVLSYLITKVKGVAPHSLAVIAIIRDWQRSQVFNENYPKAPVVKIPVKRWPTGEQERYVRERVRLHRNAEMMMDLDQGLPECSAEERWARDHTWAVIKEGGKKAAKVYDTEEEAQADHSQRRPGYEVVFRVGKSVRCEGDYCGVSKWCHQWKQMKSNHETEPEQVDKSHAEA